MKTGSHILIAIVVLAAVVLIVFVLSSGAMRTEREATVDEERTPAQQTDEREQEEAPEEVKEEEAERTVTLYYYDPSRDTDETGNVLCSAKGLIGVARSIPMTQTPIQDTIRLLLQGDLALSEEESGITTEFPLRGFELAGANLNNGVLTLAFNDPNNATTDGSCRTGVLWMQIRETALQFEGVEEVRFEPEELFQP